MSDPILRIEGLEKRFGALAATDGMNFDVSHGEVHSLIGPNGAGKTTFIAQVAGLLRPDAGRIFLDREDITWSGAPSRAKRGLARTFQITSLFREYTVFENVLVSVQAQAGHCFRFWRNVRGQKALGEIVMHILEQLGMASRRDVPAGRLAHGEQRLLEIAIALAGKPRVLLLDEPTAGMGARDSEEMKMLLASWRGRYAMVLIEHDMDAVFRLSDRISVMAGGKLIATGRPDEIRRDPNVRRAYLGNEDEEA